MQDGLVMLGRIRVTFSGLVLVLSGVSLNDKRTIHVCGLARDTTAFNRGLASNLDVLAAA